MKEEIELISYEKLNDRELIDYAQNGSLVERSKATETLIERYNMQILKNWWVLNRQFQNSALVNNVKDEYMESATEAIITAIGKIDLSKIRDDKWKLLQYSSFYIRNARNKLAKEIMRNSKVRQIDNLVNFDPDAKENVADPIVERAYRENHLSACEAYEPEAAYLRQEREKECAEILKRLYNSWSPMKQEIYKILEQDNKISKEEIAKKLGVTKNVVYNTITKMKKELKKELGVA